VIEDADLDAYLGSVLARLAATDNVDAADFSIRAIRDIHLNAFALPNGRLYIHTGLLARLRDEAQLASIIAHEMTHVTHRHALKELHDQRSKTGWLATLTSGAGDYGGLVQLFGGYGTLIIMQGYSREMESQADTVGWQRLSAAGYDTASAPDVFRMLMADVEEDERDEPFFFGSHPKLADREENFRKLQASAPPGKTPGDRGEERFEKAVAPVLLINGEAELKAGRYIAARDQLWRYRLQKPYDVHARWILGEVERRAGPEGNLDEAIELYNEALLMNPEYAPAYRSLGLIAFHKQPSPEAAALLQRYLDLEPRANDRGYIEQYIRECESSTSSNS
jgi:predicted Zn-dependent protease